MKLERQSAIRSIINSRPVRSQDELAQLLEAQGLEATQATVSRDIKELGLIKVPLKGPGGVQHFKYVEPAGASLFPSRLHRVVAELVMTIRGCLNQIVLRTPPGSAMLVASAIDSAEWPEIMGTLGGDDTVLVLLDSPEARAIVQQRFLDMMEQSA